VLDKEKRKSSRLPSLSMILFPSSALIPNVFMASSHCFSLTGRCPATRGRTSCPAIYSAMRFLHLKLVCSGHLQDVPRPAHDGTKRFLLCGRKMCPWACHHLPRRRVVNLDALFSCTACCACCASSCTACCARE
jgi:hypothetical protein